MANNELANSVLANCLLANQNLENILNSLNRKYEMIHAVWNDSKNFETKFRTQIPRDNDDFNALCDEWVDTFSGVTNTVWVKKTSNTGPKIRFRKQYQCWTHKGRAVQKDLLFDARRCKGTLDMKVLTDNPLTRRKNRHIKVGLNVVVKINFNHLHDVDTSQSFSFFVHNCEPLAEMPKLPIQPNERLPQLVAEMVQKGLISTQKQIEANSNQKNVTTNGNQNPAEAATKLINILENSQPQKILDGNSLQKIITMGTNGKLEITDKSTNSNFVKLESNDKNHTLQSKRGHDLPILIPLSSFADPPDDNLTMKLDINQQFIQDTIQLPSLNQQTIMVQNILPLQNMETVKLELQPPQLQPFTQLVVSSPQLDMSEHLLMFDASQVIPITTHNLNSHFVQLHSHNQSQFL